MRKFFNNIAVLGILVLIAVSYSTIRHSIQRYDRIQDQRMQGAPPEVQKGWGNEKTNVLIRAPKYLTMHSRTNGI